MQQLVISYEWFSNLLGLILHQNVAGAGGCPPIVSEVCLSWLGSAYRGVGERGCEWQYAAHLRARACRPGRLVSLIWIRHSSSEVTMHHDAKETRGGWGVITLFDLLGIVVNGFSSG